MEIWIGSKKIEDIESVPQSSTVETEKRIIFIYAKTYPTHPRNFIV